MSSKVRRFAGLFAIVTMIAAVTAQSALALQKRTYKFHASCVGKLVGANVSSGTCHGTFGTFKYRTVISPPIQTETDTYSNGSIKSRGTLKITNGHAGGAFVLTGGTGRFKGITGKGSFVAGSKNGNATASIHGTFRY